jgi:hypothetical protein
VNPYALITVTAMIIALVLFSLYWLRRHRGGR